MGLMTYWSRRRKKEIADRAHYKERVTELEEVVERCLKAFSLVPVEQLRQGHQWFPSEEALRAIERGRDAVFQYSQDHSQGR